MTGPLFPSYFDLMQCIQRCEIYSSEGNRFVFSETWIFPLAKFALAADNLDLLAN